MAPTDKAAGSGLSRRNFLLTAGSLGLGVAFSATLGRTLSMESIVEANTSYLKLARGTARAFAKDYSRLWINEFGRFSWWSELMSMKLGKSEFPMPQFLLSTDFFQNGADESKTVRYIKYYDPRNGCSNPFAVLD